MTALSPHPRVAVQPGAQRGAKFTDVPGAWSDVDWGNAPAWAALATASLAAGFAGRNVWHDRRDRLQQQASRVAAWWGLSNDPTFRGFPRRGSGAWLLNASDVPVYDVVVEWLHNGGVVEKRSRRVLPPSGEPEFVGILKSYGSDDTEAAERYQKVSEAIAEVEDGFDVRLSFRDARGRHWTRDADGRLTLGG